MTRSGGDQEDVPESACPCGWACAVEASKCVRRHRNRGSLVALRDQPGGRPRSWPGGVRRGGGVSLVCGSCTEREKASVETATEVVMVARGSVPTAETEGIEYRSRRSLADRPVVAVKPLLAGVAVEPRGRLTRNVHFGQPGRQPREEARRTCQSPRTSRLRFPSSWSGRRTGGLRLTRVPQEWTGRRWTSSRPI